MIRLEEACAVAMEWRPFFCVLPRRVDGRWRLLEWIERRWRLTQLSELRYRYVEEYRATP